MISLPQPAHHPPSTHTASPGTNPETSPGGASGPPRRGLVALLTALLGAALVGSLAAPASAGPVRTGTPGAAPADLTMTGASVGGVEARRHARYRGAKFQLATFNVLGSQHTRGSRRWARGTSRARTTAGVIKDRGTDIIGMQEVQKDQLRVLSNNLRGYGIWPRRRLGNNGIRLQIAWRKSRFKHLGHGHKRTTFAHQQRPVPWVKLKDRRSGAKFFVVDIHNSPNRQERARDRATRKEIRLVKRLRRTGKPVFIVGDTNEHFEFFCKVGRATSLVAPNGGNPDARPCRKPRRRLIIDWIMGGGRIDFRSYTQRRGPRVRRASDHHYVQTTVRVAHRVR